MIRITEENVIECQVHNFIADASTLEIPPGSEWPKQMECGLGNRQPLILVTSTADKAKYQQFMGIVNLIVFND